jgi:hypothetical protein
MRKPSMQKIVVSSLSDIQSVLFMGKERNPDEKTSVQESIPKASPDDSFGEAPHQQGESAPTLENFVSNCPNGSCEL